MLNVAKRKVAEPPKTAAKPQLQVLDAKGNDVTPRSLLEPTE